MPGRGKAFVQLTTKKTTSEATSKQGKVRFTCCFSAGGKDSELGIQQTMNTLH